LTWQDGKIIEEYNTIVKLPPGTVIHPRAQEVHGISFERTQDEGVEPAVVLARFREMVSTQDYYGAYNLPFDDKVMQAMAHRLQPDLKVGVEARDYVYGKATGVCVMELTRAFLRIPHTNGTGFRNVKLEQAYRRVVGKQLVGAHDAMADTRAALAVFEQLLTVVKGDQKVA